MTQHKSLDIFKFVAAILVVTLHAHPLSGYSDGDYFLTALCRVAVPFFFITSSYLFFSRGKRFGDFAKRILILYAVWFVINLPLVYVRFFKHGLHLLPFLKGLFFSSTFAGSWFLTATLEGLGLCVLLSKKCSNTVLLIIGILLYSLPLMYATYRPLTPAPVIEGLRSVSSVVSITYSFIGSFLFMVLGKIVVEKKTLPSMGAVTAGLAIACVAGIAEVILGKSIIGMNSDTLVSLPLLAFFLLMLLIHPRFCRFTGVSSDACWFMRHSSIIMYLSQFLLIATLHRFVPGMDPLVQYPVILLSTLLISMAVEFLSRRFKFFKLFY